MVKNIITNADGTYSLYTHKKGTIGFVRYEIQNIYRPLFVLGTAMFFWSRKKAKACYDYLDSSDIFKRMGGCTFKLYRNIVKKDFYISLC
jgi:hypothetical protein